MAEQRAQAADAGTRARAPPTREDVIERLNAAAATEHLAAYQYLVYAETVAGNMSRELREMFREMADGEWAHAKRFVRRVTELGGRPLGSPAEWRAHAYAVPTPPPDDPADARAMVEDALAIERDAVRFYTRLATDVQEIDPVTWRLATHVLAEEVEEEVMLRKLLAAGSL